MRHRVRAITTGTVAVAAVGGIALTVALAANATADTGSSVQADPNQSNTGQRGVGQITVPPTLGSGSSGSDSLQDGSGDQLVPAQQQPQSGTGGGSHAGSGGS